MRTEIREAQLVQHYLRAYRLVAIYVGVAKSGRTLIGHCRNVEARMHALQSEHGAVQIYGRWWCASDAVARRLIDALPRGAGASIALRDLPRIAKAASITLTSDAEIQQHVRANLLVMRARCGRQLRDLNSAYRSTRLERAAAGFKTVPYATFSHRNEIRMVYAEAAEDPRTASRRQ